jgi:hypothetical protein
MDFQQLTSICTAWELTSVGILAQTRIGLMLPYARDVARSVRGRDHSLAAAYAGDGLWLADQVVKRHSHGKPALADSYIHEKLVSTIVLFSSRLNSLPCPRLLPHPAITDTL